MAEKEKQRKLNRLATRNVVRPMVNKMYHEGVQAAKEGRPVAWCMVNWWEGDLILRSMDVTPVYPENFGTVCASDGIAQKYLAGSDAEGFPTHLCGYARNAFGYSAEMKSYGDVPLDAPLGLAKPTFMMASEGYCDARYKWFQSLRRYWEVPVWTLAFPHPGPDEVFLEGTNERNIAYMAKELAKFIEFLEGVLGKKLDWDRVEAALDNQEKVFDVWWRVNELRKTKPCPMHSRDFYTLMVPCYYMSAEKEALDGYQKVYDEVKARVDAGIGATEAEKYRVMFGELPPWHSLDFFDKLAERGWNFVTESPGYHPPPPMELKGPNDPLNRMARWTYWSFIWSLWDAKKKSYPIVPGAQHYFNWAREYEIDGIVTHSLITCRTATFWLTHASNAIRDHLSIPGLRVQGDIVDLTVFDEAAALRQAQAFEEAMEHSRSERKKRGLGW